MAGALDVKDYIAGLKAAGFEKIELTPVYFDQEMLDEYVHTVEGGSGHQVVISDGDEIHRG